MTFSKTISLAILLFGLVGCSSTLDKLPEGERLNLPTSESVSGIFFIDGETGYVATMAGDGYQTIDGGKTFSKLNFDGRDVRDFYFLNDDIGFAFGRSGFLERCDDGGKSWSRIVTDSTYKFRDMVFLDKGHGFLIGETADSSGNPVGLLGATTDKGLTWSFKITEYRGFMQIRTASPTHVWILGDDGITYSVDKGASWEHNRNRGDMVRAMVFSDIIHGWSVGDRGLLRNTSDGGWSWTDKPKLTERSLSCATSPDLDIIILGGDRFLGMTTNHGRVWLMDSLNYMTTFTDCQAVGKDVFLAGSGERSLG